MINTIYKKISSPLGGLGIQSTEAHYILFYFFEGEEWFIGS